MGLARHSQHLRRRADRAGDAERGRRRRRGPWRAAVRRADDDLHGLPGPAADAAQHVQDRRRADLDGVPCRGALGRHPGAVDLRRPFRRDGDPRQRLRLARLRFGAGGSRPRPDRPGGDPRKPHSVRAFLRRIPHLARGEQAHAALGRRDARDDPRRSRSRPSRPRADAGEARRARHRAQSGHLLPGARGGQPVLRAHAGDRRTGDGGVRQDRRAQLSIVRI